MDIIIGFLLAVLMLAAAVRVHRALPAFVTSRPTLIFVRTVLIVVGSALGMVSSMYSADAPHRILAFLIAFGLVHVPAAVILFIKEKRGASRF